MTTGKSQTKWIGLLTLVLAVGWMITLGCQSKPPLLGTYADPATVLNRSLVANFDTLPFTCPAIQPSSGPVTTYSGSPVTTYSINPNLFEMNNPNGTPPYVLTTTLGTVVLINNFPAFVTAAGAMEAPGAGGSSYAFHETGTLKDLGDFSYPSLDLQAQMEAGSEFNASHFTGVKFMMKVGPADTALHRIFSVPVFQTQAVAGGGGCTAGPRLCYDHFAADFSAGTGGQWKQFSYDFSALHQLVAGAIPNPPTLSGVNLQQVLWLQWEEGRNNTAGTSAIDLWVDDIEFY